MAYEEGDAKVYNAAKEIAHHVTLEIIIRHQNALKQARTGEIEGTPRDKIKDNDLRVNQVRALSLVIAAQREMVTHSRPVIRHNSFFKWGKKFKEEDEIKENPFAEFECDYNELMECLSFLTFCNDEILKADRTERTSDDFLVKRSSNEGEVFELTSNFYGMLEDLENFYEKIYGLMITNKIVSAGIEEDAEFTYEEQEAEMKRRIVEA
jgi:hypothetical protein